MDKVAEYKYEIYKIAKAPKWGRKAWNFVSGKNIKNNKRILKKVETQGRKYEDLYSLQKARQRAFEDKNFIARMFSKRPASPTIYADEVLRKKREAEELARKIKDESFGRKALFTGIGATGLYGAKVGRRRQIRREYEDQQKGK